ncbi:hypothetical protein MSM1_09355 [Mycobacterium sp. SM1]|uniref:hypothetical protein n=1 Tax=Mycobacterium sp. SM1 TaxID=2816243 RepID=UPI001BCC663F|nr:hypothetical protein [Mycobacterium sp. SM1]MBS4728537.1 hypothetical protein [Mycobacterium sp. SM1]
MPAAVNEKNKTAAALYTQLGKELEELVSKNEDQGYRLQELERIARIYTLVAETPRLAISD